MLDIIERLLLRNLQLRSVAFKSEGTLAIHPHLPVTSFETVSGGQGMVHGARLTFATHPARRSGRRFHIVTARQC